MKFPTEEDHRALIDLDIRGRNCLFNSGCYSWDEFHAKVQQGEVTEQTLLKTMNVGHGTVSQIKQVYWERYKSSIPPGHLSNPQPEGLLTVMKKIAQGADNPQLLAQDVLRRLRKEW